jgi:hypothetical protein
VVEGVKFTHSDCSGFVDSLREVGVRHARCTDEANADERTCRIGEMTIINNIHPMKLALGSYKIIGIPKLMKSAEGSRSIRVVGIQMMTIRRNVKHDVRNDAIKHLFNNLRKSVTSLNNICGTNQPTTSPRRIAKIGTPIPAPIANRSRRQNAMIGNTNLRGIILDILFFF